jgi:hypothetical protein
MSDTIHLTFPDQSTYKIEVGAGQGQSVVDEILAGRGEFKDGWILDKQSERRWINVRAALRMELTFD